MLSRIVRFKVRDRTDDVDPIGHTRIRAEEIVLRETSHKSIATQQQRNRLDDCGLSGIIRADQHGKLPHRDLTGPDTTEAFYGEIGDAHVAPNWRPVRKDGYAL
jgi:hypothetical protein